MFCSRSNEIKPVFKENKNTKSFVAAGEGPRINSCLVCGQNHHVYQCSKFKSMSLEDRLVEVSKHKLCNNCLRAGHDGSQCTLKGSCRNCKKKHNSLLHCESVSNNNNKVATTDTAKRINSSVNMSTADDDESGQVMLCTAQVEVYCPKSNTTHLARALLDNASQSSFISESFKKKLNLPTNKIEPFDITGINKQKTEISERIQLKVRSRVNSYELDANCWVIPTIADDLPYVAIDVEKLDLPHVELADPLFYKPDEVDILLSGDKFFKVLKPDHVELGEGKPILQDSKFGWLVAGRTDESYNRCNVYCHLATTRRKTSLQDVDDSLKRFWEVENLPSDCKSLSIDEEFCETHYVENTVRLPDGRFSVQMPFKEKPEDALGNSYPIAMRRFLNLEKKLDKNPIVKNQYRDFLQEYADLGHMTEVGRPSFGCYLPHHCVIREQKETTKLRVVYDASALTSSGKSLNCIQAIGPVVQSDLFSILLRFRTNRFVLTADIEKMYRQVSLSEQQRHLQLILWRDQADQPVKIFQLNTVTYGMASAPFVTTRCLKQLALECQDEVTSNVIKNDFYIDDLNTGSSTHLPSLSFWWEGPSFLKKDSVEWPSMPQAPSDLPEVKALLTTVRDETSSFGAHNELGRVLRSSCHPVSDYAANESINFKFIPAYAPNFGGIWEAGVRAAKFHLKPIAGNANLTFEELTTLFVQIEAILNSRPITPLSSDPNDMNPLTPGHFLISRPLTSSVPSLPVTGNPATRYKRIELLRQQFWERWRREFMAELQQRVKWKTNQRGIQLGDLVLLKEDNLMPLQWRMGRVIHLYKGPDGVCRVADIQTEKGLIKRAVNKMCLLPTDPEPNDEGNNSKDDQTDP
ncbi:uncharacterized protein LOC125234887 [Leguminivora glycinivorella]|uniref:uncharacterized protein LOC125234887 n=1 Tax=Leguminivora glycinivorella TaxID=1035111 RepID=UPI00200E8A8C|nr:uncharacterized protein LOC125234887 [Leguminivora glycinivorella]